MNSDEIKNEKNPELTEELLKELAANSKKQLFYQSSFQEY